MHNAGGLLTKMAVISLTSRTEGTPGVLERELWEALIHNDKISSKWFVDKISILDDTELEETSQLAE